VIVDAAGAEHPVVSNLIRHLDAFNRKERFFLTTFAVGPPAVLLDSGFRDAVGHAIGLNIPPSCRWWMDYHLDWLYAALVLNDQPEPSPGPYASPGFLSAVDGQAPFNLNTNQEDVDLLLAFGDADVTHLVLIEAKADTGWTNKQLQSKGRRLRVIFGEGTLYNHVVPHFVITSPREPRRLKTDTWPAWMAPGGRPPWVKLETSAEWRRVERCDEQGNRSGVGSYWRVK
jgi:hypothetical protein